MDLSIKSSAPILIYVLVIKNSTFQHRMKTLAYQEDLQGKRIAMALLVLLRSVGMVFILLIGTKFLLCGWLASSQR